METWLEVVGGWTVSQKPKLINATISLIGKLLLLQEFYSSWMLPSARRLIAVLLADTKCMQRTW